MPQVSVIVPVYKAERYLRRCVDSILSQTLEDLEVILVDDGSPDTCPQLCDFYSKKDLRVRVIHQKNAGVAAARNKGLEAAVGEYITFVDSDDYIEPSMYSAMMKIAKEYNSDVVMCDCLKEYSDHAEPYTHDIRPGFYTREELEKEYYPHLLMMENLEYPATISNWLCMFRNTPALAGIRYEVGIRYSEDLLFGAQLLRQANSFYYMKDCNLYHYFMNDQSATHKYVPDKWNDYRKLYQKIFENFADDQVFDFRLQIDLCLLFFVYNAVGDIYGVRQLSTQEKNERIRAILSDDLVRSMFERLKICRLNISYKQKIITLCYKYRVGLSALIRYYH